MRLDADGDTLWTKALGGSAGDLGYGGQQTADGGYIIVGTVWSNDGDVMGNHGSTDGWVVKLDAGADIEWQRTLGGSGPEDIRGIHQTSDGGYMVVGSTFSSDGDVSNNHGSGDTWLVKLEVSGHLAWEKTFGGSDVDDGWVVRQVSDGFIVVGGTGSSDGDVVGHHHFDDGWVLKLDDAGELAWQLALGGSDIDGVYSVAEVSDGYVVAGCTRSNDGDVTGWHAGWDLGGSLNDAWVVKITASGAVEWQRVVGGSSSDLAFAVRATSGGNLLVAGATGSSDGDVTGGHGGSDLWVVELDGTGSVVWQKCMGGSGDEEAMALNLTGDGGCIAAGRSTSQDGDLTSNLGQEDVWVVKLAGTPTALSEGAVPGPEFMNDPSSDQLWVTLPDAHVHGWIQLTDATGRTVMRSRVDRGTSVLQTSTLCPGPYVITLQRPSGWFSRRMILE